MPSVLLCCHWIGAKTHCDGQVIMSSRILSVRPLETTSALQKGAALSAPMCNRLIMCASVTMLQVEKVSCNSSNECRVQREWRLAELLYSMGAGNSSLVRDSPQRHVNTEHQDKAASSTRPEAWADLVSLIIMAFGHHLSSKHLSKFVLCRIIS